MWTQQKVHIDSPRKYLEAQEKKQPKTLLSYYVLLEVCNNLWKNCLLKSLSREFQSKWAFFLLSISIICISLCHLAAKSLVMGYICCCHVACCLPPSSSPCLLRNPKAIFTALSPAFCSPDSSQQKGPTTTRQGVALAHKNTRQ